MPSTTCARQRKVQHDQRSEEVDERDAHEDAEDAEVAQVERLAVSGVDRFEEQRRHPAEEDQQGGAANDTPVDRAVELRRRRDTCGANRPARCRR